MFVSDYLSKDFTPPNSHQNAGKVLQLIEDFNVTHVPVFEGLNFIGNLSEESLEEIPTEAAIGEYKKLFDHFYLTDNSTLFDAIHVMYTHDANIVPVFNNEEHYLGFITFEDIVAAMSAMPFVSEPGAVMFIEASQKQFSFSEISQIVESNNAKLFGAIITSYIEDKVQIMVKLGTNNLVSVGETFERYGYEVIHKLYNDEKQELLKGRFDQLMKYLNT